MFESDPYSVNPFGENETAWLENGELKVATEDQIINEQY